MSQGPLLQPGSCGHLGLCPHCLLFGVLLLPYLGQWCWYRPSRVQNILNGNWGPQAVMTGKKGHCSGKKPNNHWKTDKRETQASDSNDSGSSHSEATLPFLWCLSEVPFLLSQQIGVKFVLLETSHNWKQGRRFWEWHLESLLLTMWFWTNQWSSQFLLWYNGESIVYLWRRSGVPKISFTWSITCSSTNCILIGDTIDCITLIEFYGRCLL